MLVFFVVRELVIPRLARGPETLMIRQGAWQELFKQPDGGSSALAIVHAGILLIRSFCSLQPVPGHGEECMKNRFAFSHHALVGCVFI